MEQLSVLEQLLGLKQLVEMAHQENQAWLAHGSRSASLQRKSHFCIPFLGIARPQSQFPHSYVCERFIYFKERSTYLAAAGNLKTEHYNSVLEIRRLHSFLWGNT
jgi:hypothetical protein